MTSRTLSISAALAVASLAVASPTGADTVRVPDGVDERAAPLDIVRIGHGHGRRAVLTHRVTMRERWRPRLLAPGRGELELLFDLDGRFHAGHPRFERRVVIRFRDGRLRGTMRGGRDDRVLGRVRLWRPDARSIAVGFPKRLLRARLVEYYWFARTLVYCGEHICGGDQAPGPSTSIPETLTHSLRSRLVG